jgi:probable O-glycosylation ligase (exosortase A-associated)
LAAGARTGIHAAQITAAEVALRDLLIFAAIFGVLPFVLVRPWIGVLLWVWLSLMNPHRLAWGAAYDFPFAQLIAVVTLVGLLFSREPIRWKGGAPAIVLLMFAGWTCVTTLFALVPSAAEPMLERFLKIQLFTFVALLVLYTRKHVLALVWIFVLSIGFYGVKGGVFTIVSGGQGRVWGPPDSFIFDNNALAVAIVMTIPLWIYLYRIHHQNIWLRIVTAGAAVLSAAAALGSQSRGALLTLVATAFFLWARTRGKLVSAVALVVIGVALISVMPEKWTERMRSINPETGMRDSSSQGRLDAWTMLTNLAIDRPIVGGGFEPYSRAWDLYSSSYHRAYSAHSIYFSALGEHGFVGLLLFLLLWFLTWRFAGRLANEAKGRKEEDWAYNLARLSKASLVAYLVGGAFLDLAYWDGPYFLLAALGVARYALMAERNAGAVGVPHRESIGQESKSIVAAKGGPPQ